MRIDSKNKGRISANLESLQTPRGIKKTMGTATSMEFRFTDACPRMHEFDDYWTTTIPPVHHPKSRVLVMDGCVDKQTSVTTLIFGGNYAKWFPEVDIDSKDSVIDTWNDNYADVDGLKFTITDGKLDAEFIMSTSTTK